MASVMEALDGALDAKPTVQRRAVLLLLAALWLVPQPPYVRYFAALPFDASNRCSCPDLELRDGGSWAQQVAAAAAGGQGCCPINAAAGDASECAVDVDPEDCRALVDDVGTSCLTSDLKPGCSSSACMLCGPEQRVCEQDASTLARTWDLYCGDQSQIGLLGVVFYLGVLFGALVGATLSDHFGRRPVTVGGEVAAGLLTLAMAAAPEFSVYACLQFGAGFATSVCNISGFTLAAELTGPASRTKLSIELFSWGWALMCLIMPGLGYAFSDSSWRSFHVFCSSAILIHGALLLKRLPESPRWLLEQRRYDEVDTVVGHLLGQDAENASWRASDAFARHFEQWESSGAVRSPDEENERNQLSSAVTVLKPVLSGPTLLVTLGICYLWFAASMSYYGISYNSGNLSDSIYMNWILTSALPLFPSTLFGIWYIDLPTIGRTKGNSSMFGACCLCIGIGSFFPAVATPMSTLGNFFANSVFNCVYISVPELYPTKYRGAVLAMSSASARFGSMAASYLPNYIGGTGTLMIVTVVCFVAMLVSIVLIPETQGRPMPSVLPTPLKQGSSASTVRGCDDELLVGPTTAAGTI